MSKKIILLSLIFLVGFGVFVSASYFTFENDGSSKIKMNTTIKNGDITLDLLYGNGTAYTGIGKDNNNQLAVSNSNSIFFNQTAGAKYIIASWNSSTESETYYLRVEIISEDGLNKTRFTNMITSDQRTVAEGNEVAIGNVIIIPSGIQYAGGSTKWTNLTAGEGVSFNKIFNINGSYFYLPTSNQLPSNAYSLNVYNRTDFLINQVNMSWVTPQAIANNSFSNYFTFENDGFDTIKMNTSIKDGDVAFDLLYGNGTTYLGLGRDNNSKLVTSNTSSFVFNQTNGDRYVVVSWNDSVNFESYYLREEIISEDGFNKTRFTNVLTSVQNTISEGGDLYLGDVAITVSNINYTGLTKWATLTAGENVSFNIIFNQNGSYFYLPTLDQLPSTRYEITGFDSSKSQIGVSNLSWIGYTVSIVDTPMITPQVNVLSPTAITYSSTSIALQVTSNEAVTWIYSLNGGANVTFTPNTTIMAISGSNSLKIYVVDNYGNTNSSTINFAVSISSSSSSSGGGGGAIATQMINNAQLTQGVLQSMSVGQKLIIQLPVSFANEETINHTIILNKVINNTISLTIRSDPINLNLTVGEERKLSLNNASYYDLYIRLDSVTKNKVNLTIQSIHELVSMNNQSNVGILANDSSVQNEIAENNETALKNYYLIGGIVLVVTVLILIFWILVGRKRK